MFQSQRRRFFPLPDYDLTNPERVAVEISGRILDERYTRLLMANTELDLDTIRLLDRVQKRKHISQEEHRRLKAAKLVEGRYPNLIVAAQVAAVTGEKAKHIRDGGLDNRYYRDLIIELIGKHQPVSREVINELLLGKLPEMLNQDQKMDKIHNLISSLSGRRIRNIGSRRTPRWVLMADEKQ